jgi:hypothetical protein
MGWSQSVRCKLTHYTHHREIDIRAFNWERLA